MKSETEKYQESQIGYYSLNEEKDNKKIKWYVKLIRFCLRIPIFFIALLYENRLKERQRRIKQIKKKLKYFNPTIHECFFGNTVSWTGREKPLSDEEVNNLIKQKK